MAYLVAAGACLEAALLFFLSPLAQIKSYLRFAIPGLTLFGVMPVMVFLPPLPFWFALLAVGFMAAALALYLSRQQVKTSWSPPFFNATSFAFTALWCLAYVITSWLVFSTLMPAQWLGRPALLALVVSVMALGLLDLLRTKLGTEFRRRWGSQKYREFYEASAVIGRALVQPDFGKLAEAVLARICSGLNIPSGFVACRADPTATFYALEAIYPSGTTPLGTPLEIPTLERPTPPSDLGLHLSGSLPQITILFPVCVRAEQLGVLALAAPADGRLDTPDLEQVESICGQLAIGLENIILRKELTAKVRELSELGESVLNQQIRPRSNLSAKVASIEAPAGRPHSVEVKLLGGFCASVDGRVIKDNEWGGRSSGHRHSQATFAYLVANRQRVVTRAELLEVVWGDSTDLATLQSRLDRTISALRRTLEPTLLQGTQSQYILTTIDGYSLNAYVEWLVDVEQFRNELRSARDLRFGGEAAQACTAFEKALDRYDGDYMVSVSFVERSYLITAEREALRRQYMSARVEYGQLLEQVGRRHEAIEQYKKAALEDEFNEDVYQALTGAYRRANRFAEAELVCRTHDRILREAGLPCSRHCLAKRVYC
jgi:DNA-binding SARP family transcriptional activator